MERVDEVVKEDVLIMKASWRANHRAATHTDACCEQINERRQADPCICGCKCSMGGWLPCKRPAWAGCSYQPLLLLVTFHLPRRRMWRVMSPGCCAVPSACSWSTQCSTYSWSTLRGWQASLVVCGCYALAEAQREGCIGGRAGMRSQAGVEPVDSDVS